MMKCSTKEITTVQVFGKTAKNGLKSINVVSKSHWHSPVLLKELLKQKIYPKTEFPPLTTLSQIHVGGLGALTCRL